MITLLLLGASVSAVAVDHVALADRSIRVGDIAAAPGYEDQVIGVLPDAQNVAELDAAAARQMLRNRFPMMPFSLRFEGKVRLTAPPARGADRGGCLATLADVPSGEAITPANTGASDCPSERTLAPLGYDARSGTVFARRFIAAGTNLGALRLKAVEVVPEGRTMALRFAAGPVVVERQVTLLQPGVAGSRVFVKTDEGDVITASLVSGQEGAEQ